MGFILEISGELACFTRPELKVERVSYPVITPSAARNILMAILWKPAIRWQVKKIEILKPIRWANVRRNEVGIKMRPQPRFVCRGQPAAARIHAAARCGIPYSCRFRVDC